MNALYLLFLLLPLAAYSGWYIARRGSERSSGARVNELSSNYFRGLNYLLNEQPDKAIEVFLKLAEINVDTVETHLALGNLFRRRGEIDRAIRVHQHLISRPALSDDEKSTALLELGEDYMRSGLLDRAEKLFTDLVAMGAHSGVALTHLVAISQHERDWNMAIEHARSLQQVSSESHGTLIAQFYCELAEQSRTRSASVQARDYLQQAFSADPACVRAGMILGHLERAEGNLLAAIEAFEQIAERDVDYLGEILAPLLDCYARSHQMQRAEDFLLDTSRRYPGVAPILELGKIYARSRGEAVAADFLAQELRTRPSLRALLAMSELGARHTDGVQRERAQIQQEMVRKLLHGQSLYRCTQCGFGARTQHWQCPGCKTWSSVRPVHGARAEPAGL